MRAVLITALAAVVLLTGCSNGEPEDDRRVLGMQGASSAPAPTSAPTPTATKPRGPVPLKPVGQALPVKINGPGAPVLASEAPSKGSGSVTSQILEAMRLRTDYMAGYKGSTGGRCDRGRVRLAANATTYCTVSYKGRSVRWYITISSDYKSGDYFIRYQIYPVKAVLLAKAVYSEWWSTNKSGDHKALRCSKIPPISIITPDATTSYKCQRLRPQVDTTAPYWEDSKISISDYGVEFETQ